MSSSARLTEGPVASTLKRMTLPMIIAMLAMIAFHLTDTFFVSRLGTAPLAAMSFTFPIVFIINSLTLGIGTGAGAVIARAIGAGDSDRVRRLTTDSLTLALILVGIVATIGLLTIKPVFTLLGATGETLPLIRQYVTIWYSGVIFVVIPMVGNAAIRATGDTKTPSYIMLFAVTVNLILDPLLIFGIGPFPRLELQGAAIATVSARASTMVLMLWVLIRREKMISFLKPKLGQMFDSWKSILYIGLPTAGTNVVVPLAIGIITRLVSGYGPAAVAALGVATRIDPFALGAIYALSSALGPMVGQNFGAGKMGRVEEAVKVSHRFAFFWGLCALILIEAFAQPIASLFSKDPAVVGTTIRYLRLVPIGYGMQGLVLLTATTLNVLHKPLHAATLVVIQMFVLYIPLAFLGSKFLGLSGIFGAAAIANIIAGILSFWWVRRILKIISEAERSAPYM